MPEKFPRSPYDAIDGLVYFLRMLDKIRLQAEGTLPTLYVKHLGTDFDGRCVRFLGVAYDEVKKRVLDGEPDEAVFAWCLARGRQPNAEEIETWSGFMTKRGWRDEVSDRIVFRLKESGIEDRDKEAGTMFDFIDLDEGRTPPDFRQWEPPRMKKT